MRGPALRWKNPLRASLEIASAASSIVPGLGPLLEPLVDKIDPYTDISWRHMVKLDSTLERALRTYKDAVRRLSDKDVAPPVVVKGPETLVEWLPAPKALRRIRKQVERDVAVAKAQIAAANEAGSGDLNLETSGRWCAA